MSNVGNRRNPNKSAGLFRTMLFIGLPLVIASCTSTANSHSTGAWNAKALGTATAQPGLKSGALGVIKRTPSPKTRPIANRAAAKAERLASSSSVTRKEVKQYLEDAESLLGRAEADVQSGGPGQDQHWFDDDRALQAKGDILSRRLTSRLARTQPTGATTWDGIAFDIVTNTKQAESFLFSAVQDILVSCNKHDANANLRVARAGISEARRDFAKMDRDPENWSPPEIEETGGDQCAR